jgi:RNA polymerase sporulation-specific sigma factor
LLTQPQSPFADPIAVRNRLVEKHVGLVHAVALRFRPSLGLDYEDLVQEGMLALIRAAELFDPKQGTEFTTYATTTIRHRLIKTVSRSKLIHIPESAEVAELPIAQEPLSLDLPIGDETDTRLGDTVEDGQAEDEEAIVRRIHLRELLSCLPTNLRRVLELRYSYQLTQVEVAHLLGVNQMMVSRQEMKALAALRAGWDTLQNAAPGTPSRGRRRPEPQKTSTAPQELPAAPVTKTTGRLTDEQKARIRQLHEEGGYGLRELNSPARKALVGTKPGDL